MSEFRSTSLTLVMLLGGFVVCTSLTGGCSLLGGEEASGGSSPAASGSGSGGSAGAGGMTSSSSSSGAIVECSDHTSLDETNCSIIQQNCKKPGEMCIPAAPGTACIYETGIKGAGASCTNTEECAAGLACVFFSCAPYCCPSQAPAFCGSAKCNVNIDLGGGNAWACNFAKACTLFGNDCPENQQCRLGDPDQELSLCAPRSDSPSPEGGPCGFLNDCGANQICSGDVCRYSCSLLDWQSKEPGQGGCPKMPMQTCTSVSTNFGVCGL